jgi:uncharacterized protein
MEQNSSSWRKIRLYLLYTFALTWSCWLFIILCNKYFNTLWYGSPICWIPYTIGDLAPAISGYIIYRQFSKNRDKSSFLTFVFGRKIDEKMWGVFVLFSMWRFFMIWVSFGIHQPISILSMLINLPFLILWGGLEELGWRGILQPQLEKTITYLPSVLVTGIIWSVWHLPLWWMHGTVQSAFPFGLYLASGIVLTSSFTTLYKYTNNLFICILSHAWFNGCIGLALFVGDKGGLELDINWKVMLVFSIELIVSIILGILYNRRKNAEKERLY